MFLSLSLSLSLSHTHTHKQRTACTVKVLCTLISTFLEETRGKNTELKKNSNSNYFNLFMDKLSLLVIKSLFSYKRYVIVRLSYRVHCFSIEDNGSCFNKICLRIS